MADMNVKDWLEAGAYAVAILSALSGAIAYVLSERTKRIASNRRIIARGWTNEGAIDGQETHYVTLKLENSDGDIIGSLESPSLDRPLELNATVGWRSTELRVSEPMRPTRWRARRSSRAWGNGLRPLAGRSSIV